MDYENVFLVFEKNQREWLAGPTQENQMWNKQMARIDEDLKNDDIYNLNLKLRASTLGVVYNYCWQKAGVALLDGNLTVGWENYELARRLLVWRLRLEVANHLRTIHEEKVSDKPRTFNYYPALIAAMAAGDDESTRKLGEFFGNYYTAKEFADDAFGEGWPEISGFALYLYLEWRGSIEGLDYPEAINLGIYRQLFDHWHDKELQYFADALLAILDHHIDGMWDKKPYSFRFEACPFGFFPTEFYAIRRIRAKQGLEMPHLGSPACGIENHPLLLGPFGNPPDPLPRGEDTVFDEAIARIREVYPDV